MLQVFSIFMHLQHAAANCVEGQADKSQYAAKLQELTAAAEAVTEAELRWACRFSGQSTILAPLQIHHALLYVLS